MRLEDDTANVLGLRWFVLAVAALIDSSSQRDLIHVASKTDGKSASDMPLELALDV